MSVPLKAAVSGERASGCGHCGEVFSGLTGFDAHQQWDRDERDEMVLTCLDPLALGMEKNRMGRWHYPRPEGAEDWWT